MSFFDIPGSPTSFCGKKAGAQSIVGCSPVPTITHSVEDRTSMSLFRQQQLASKPRATNHYFGAEHATFRSPFNFFKKRH